MPGHVPVLRQEAVRLLVTDPVGTYVDATLGEGGHSAEILRCLGGAGRVIGTDCDPAAVRRAKENPPAPAPRFIAVRARFSNLELTLSREGIGSVDGVLADLGLSSVQLEDSSRGLSFGIGGPLDLRLDPDLPESADELLRRSHDEALVGLLRDLGELPRARSAVRAIRGALSRERPLTASGLRSALEPLYGGRERTRRLAQAFQALRIAVNRELEELDALLEAAPRFVKPGGTLCVISYHSLEDRRVKRAFRPPRPLDPFIEPRETAWEPITRRPLRPAEEELASNPRARSARLRAARRRPEVNA